MCAQLLVSDEGKMRRPMTAERRCTYILCRCRTLRVKAVAVRLRTVRSVRAGSAWTRGFRVVTATSSAMVDFLPGQHTEKSSAQERSRSESCVPEWSRSAAARPPSMACAPAIAHCIYVRAHSISACAHLLIAAELADVANLFEKAEGSAFGVPLSQLHRKECVPLQRTARHIFSELCCNRTALWRLVCHVVGR